MTGRGRVFEPPAIREDALSRLLQEPIDWRYKGFPPADGVTVGTVAQGGWNLLRGDLPLPALVLKETALAHNIALIASWCREHAVLHAPHGKTTMAPQRAIRRLCTPSTAPVTMNRDLRLRTMQ